MFSNPTMLVILDGFGYRKEKKYNAIANAYMPNFNAWLKTYPHAFLAASGDAVGLPEYMNGNSEVGHFTIGAGRIIDQPMKQWLESIEDGSFENNKVLMNEFEKLQKIQGTLHIMGLLSDSGVHSHENQIHAIIDRAVKSTIKKIIMHAFLDGRDVAPQSASLYLEKLTKLIHCYKKDQVVLGSIHGRFYAMDRDNNWDRTEKSYRVLTEKQSITTHSWQKILEHAYSQGTTDEFIIPTQLNEEAIIKNGDGIVFCNIRPDRARQLTASFIIPQLKEFTAFTVKPLKLAFFITPIFYDDDVPTTALFSRKPVENTLKDILAQQGKTILSIAETEKYAHVTYFFRGENEEAVSTETRIMIPSIKAETYKNYPEMSAKEITQVVVNSLYTNPYDFYLINYANADMVGHSGDFDATVTAIEYLDKQLALLYEACVIKKNGTLYITADHGKAEDMFDESVQQPRTSHTSNKVPFLMIRKNLENSPFTLSLTQLSDIAPFIIQNL